MITYIYAKPGLLFATQHKVMSPGSQGDVPAKDGFYEDDLVKIMDNETNVQLGVFDGRSVIAVWEDGALEVMSLVGDYSPSDSDDA